jgi:hypothetical protein
MTLEGDRSENPFFLLAGKIKSQEKNPAKCCVAGTLSHRESPPPISKQNQYSSRIFTARLVWITVDVGKHKT